VLVHDVETGLTYQMEVLSGPNDSLGGNGGMTYSGLFGDYSNQADRVFATMALVLHPATFPRSTACRVRVQFTDTTGSQWIFGGSAHLIDAETAITAGHVAYMHSFTDSSGVVHTVNNWFEWMTLYPGSHQQVDHWGDANVTNVVAWTGWTESSDVNWDIALLRVDRAVGMLTGWTGWRWGDSCATIQNRAYHNFSFPAHDCGSVDGNGNQIHNGQDMYKTDGQFETCTNNELRFTTFPGCLTRV